MAKEPAESPADKLKREQALKEAAAKEAERIANESEETVNAQKDAPEEEPAVEEEAKAPEPAGGPDPFAEIEAAEDPRQAARERAEAARDKLFRIAQSYPVTTPDEHTIFGFGGIRYNLGDLRSLFGLNTRR